MSDWQPIETAPTNGSVVIVADHFSVCPAYYAGETHKCWRNWYKGCRYEAVHLGTDCFLPEQVWFEPTQWTPFPKPPSISPSSPEVR